MFLKPAPSGPGRGAEQMSGSGSQAWSRMLGTGPATHFPTKHSENICTVSKASPALIALIAARSALAGSPRWDEGEKIALN